jgi:alkylation response protein AidB-like acyl-CoA dehydrogenase
VPRIIKNEVSWCTLYSEPNAGSDLASLQTRAEEDGDFFVVNGQKIWTSGAHLADWGILACRTDQNMERHRGISVLLVEMKTPGITVRPLVNMAGSAGFNQVFFDNVRVPKNNLLGEKNRGWQILRFGLNFERSRTNFVLQAAENIAGLVQFAKERARNGKPLSKDPMVRQKLADLAIRNRVSKNLSYRIVWMQATNQTITYQANVDKVFETELTQEIARMGIFLAGMHGQLLRGPHALLDGQPAQSYLQTVGLTIAAGTSEVQRNGIAQGLGLPRSYEV